MSYTRKRKPPPPPPLQPVEPFKTSKSLFSSQNRTRRRRLPEFLRQPESSEGFTDTDSIDTSTTIRNIPDIVTKAKETPHFKTWSSVFNRIRRNPEDDVWTDDSDIDGGRRRRKKRSTRKTRRKWSLKYKKSINCKKPRGFSQKQYCKYGRKK